MKLGKHFTLQEMTKSQTAARKKISNVPGTEDISNLKALVENVLDKVRAHFKSPVIVNSGYRSPKLNRAIGGSKTSQHCKGQAADIEVPGVSNLEVAEFIRDNLDFDQLILENYDPIDPSSGWVHVSYVRNPNRGQTLTFDGKKYHKGIKIL